MEMRSELKKLTSVFWEQKSTAEAMIRQVDRSESLGRAFKALGIWWLLAIVGVFIPVLHFVIVPLFLVLGVYFALKQSRVRFEIEGGHFICPACGVQNAFEKGRAFFPREERCVSCFVTVQIEETSNS